MTRLAVASARQSKLATHGFDGAPNWRSRALCHPGVAELFVYGRGLTDANMAALKLCRSCPVRRECADDIQAVAPAYRQGLIAGGMVFDGEGAQTTPSIEWYRRRQWAASKERARQATPTDPRGTTNPEGNAP